MDKRIRLGFVYLWDESWLGGVYYTQNLLKALDTLDEEKKPIVHVYCLSNKAFDELKSNTKYPYLEMTIVKKSFCKRLIRYILRLFIQEKADSISIFNITSNDDMLFPSNEGPDVDKLVYWMPDFQAKYLTTMFRKKDIDRRDFTIKSCCKRGVPILFSSYDSQNDFFKFFPKYQNHPTFVVHFATNLPDFSSIKFKDLKNKYGITKHYLFCANQFWKHKNHMFLFKCFKIALDKGLDMQLICTGKMEDYRNPEYIDGLKLFIDKNNLNQHILTLGVIDKKELLCLMKNSYAVIQPSLFEGWNTTVEDCKALNKYVFLSDLRVHREQMSKNVCFFDPSNEDDLVNKLLTIVPKEEVYNYTNCLKQFGEDFYQVIKYRASKSNNLNKRDV